MGNWTTKFEQGPFGSLPNEMRVEVFRHLDLDSKKASRLVCASWSALINPMLRLAPDLSDETVSSIALSSLSMTVVSLTTRKLQNPKSVPDDATWLDSVTQIIVGEDSAGLGVSERNLRNLFSRCAPKLERLQFEEAALKNLTGFQLGLGLNLDHLTRLGIEFETYKSYEPTHHHAVVSLLTSAAFPQLAVLRVSFAPVKGSCLPFRHPSGPYAAILTSAYAFIGRHHTSLRDLRLNEAQRIWLDPPVTWQLPDSTFDDLRRLQLTHLRLLLGPSDQNGHHPQWAVNCFALAPNDHNHNLVTLDVSGCPIPPEFTFTIMDNVRSLRTVRWNALTHHALGASFDISSLAQARTLLNLTVSANRVTNLTFLPTQIERLTLTSAHALSTDHLLWIACHLRTLRTLVVKGSALRGGPFVTLDVLKMVVALADSLELWKFYGGYEEEEISEFCGAMRGLQLSKVKVNNGAGFRLEVDQRVLDKSRLE